MVRIETWKIVLILALTVYGVLLALPNMYSPSVRDSLPGWLPSKTINLGLDLQGGSHLLLQVDMKKAMEDRFQSMADGARSELRSAKLSYSGLRALDNGITFKIDNVETDRSLAYKTARNIDREADVDIKNDGTVTLTMTERGYKEIQASIVNHSIEIIRRRVDETGTKEPLIQRQGDDRIVLQLPGLENPDDVKALLGKTAKMTFHLVDDTATMGGASGFGTMMLPSADMGGEKLAIRKRALLGGDSLVDAQPSFGQNNEPVVSFKFDSLGGKRFCEITRQNVGKPFAIVLDNTIISAPRINEAICGGQGIISGRFDVKSANELALLLRAGALPAPLNVIEERSVGPSLGADSIAAGEVALKWALALVIAYMVLVYGLFGVFASVALIFNMVFIMSFFSLLQATLTMPGIAGIVLTIGMAVDANVLIFERIREMLRGGRSIISAIDTGYTEAMNTIIDSNLTTLIAAVVLFMLGSGPIKGFGVALTIGIVTSMFSAIMLTRLMVLAWLKQTKPKTLTL